jgi:5-methyltetrahydrofolate--homocysteine methyltransferase
VTPIDNPPNPPFWGSRIVRDITLDEVAEWLDERALFTGRWGMRAEGDFDAWANEVARPRLRRQLDRMREADLCDFKVVYGYWPVASSGDEVLIFDPDHPTEQIARLSFPRQAGSDHLCLADYFLDVDAPRRDVIGLQLVTVGRRMTATAEELFAADAYRDYLEFHGTSVQLAEALAECWHAKVREELGIADQDGSLDQILRRQRYRGERFSFGYPACPDLEQRAVIFDLLDAERLDVRLSDTFQLEPEQSTDAIVLHHPQARYFSVR